MFMATRMCWTCPRWATARRLLIAWVVVVMLSGSVVGQTLEGPFRQFNTWWLNPNDSTLGVIYSNNEVCIDRDGNGTLESCYPHPEISPGNPVPAAGLTNLRLSPTREILYLSGGTCGVEFGTMVYFFEVPNPPAPLSLITMECIDIGIADAGFYDTGLCCEGPTDPACSSYLGLVCDTSGMYALGISDQRVAYVESGDNPFTDRSQIHWFDLTTPGAVATTFPGFNSLVQSYGPLVSPYGDAGFVEHDVGDDQYADYTVIELCCNEKLGRALTSNVGGPLFDLDSSVTTATAEMVDLGGGNWVVRVTHPDLPSKSKGTYDVPFTPCSQTSTTPATGACCKLDATCAVETADDCEDVYQGDWLGPDTDCSDCEYVGACCITQFGICIANLDEATCLGLPYTELEFGGVGSICAECPQPPNLYISKAAPTEVQEGRTITYTITYGNAGSDADGVEVEESLPSGAYYVSASNAPGGVVPTVNGGVITWAIGDLPGGTVGQQVTVTARVGCGVSEITNTSCVISASVGNPKVAGPVTTTVSEASDDPVGISVVSVDLNGPPVMAGDEIQHTVTLVNTTGVAHDLVSINGESGGNVACGNVSTFGFAVDAAGGEFEVTANRDYFTWEGSIGASTSLDVVFTTHAKDCLPTSRTLEALNRGRPITVRNACGDLLGNSNDPDQFDVALPIRTELQAVNLGPPQPMELYPDGRVQAAREGALLEFELTIEELYGVSHGNVTVSIVIPDSITPDPVADPLVNPPAGASYDTGSRTITYNGTVGAYETIVVRWNGILNVDGPCSTAIYVTGDIDGCVNRDSWLSIIKVPVLPTGPYVITLRETEGLYLFQPDVPDSSEALLCLQGEGMGGITRTDYGEIWMAGVTTIIRFNPEVEPPDLEIFTSEFGDYELGIINPSDVAYDPTTPDPSFIFVGTDSHSNAGYVRRYTPSAPAGQRVEVILDDGNLASLLSVKVDAEGMIAATTYDQLIRIDPTGVLPVAPGDYALFDLNVDSDFGGLLGMRFDAKARSLTLDKDGNYLMMVATTFMEDLGNPGVLPFRFTDVHSLVRVDRTAGTVGTPTGEVEVVVEELGGTVTCAGMCPSIPPPADFSHTMFPDTDLSNYRGLAGGADCRAFLGSTYLGDVPAVDRSCPVSGVLLVGMGPAKDLEFVGEIESVMPGDYDESCSVDIDDYPGLADCLDGPGAAPLPTPPETAGRCLEVFDFDVDGDVDLADFGAFALMF